MMLMSFPNVYSQTINEQTCLELISAQQVKEITGYEGEIEGRIINADLAALNDHLDEGCYGGYEDKDRTFVLGVGISIAKSDEVAQEKWDEGIQLVKEQNFPAEIKRDKQWEYYALEIDAGGLTSLLSSKKGTMLVAMNAPGTDNPITDEQLIEMAKIIHSNVDANFGNMKKNSEGNSNNDNSIKEKGMEIKKSKTPPVKQIAQGKSPQEVTCNEGLVLVIKNGGVAAACVKSATSNVLLERGWAIPNN